MKKDLSAGVIQFDVKKGLVEANLKTALGYLEKLAQKKVSLAVLPEMFSCSFDNEHLNVHSQQSDKVIHALSAFAETHHIAIAGTLPEMENDRIFNTMVFIDVDGKIKGKYRKLHLFRLTHEHLYYGAGDQVGVIDTSFGRIGLMTCYDLRFPELARSLCLQGAQLIVVSAQWPTPRKEHWQTLVRARAIENQLFMVCSNRTGNDGQLSFPGSSLIVDPMGTVLADAGPGDTEVSASIDFEQVTMARTLIPCQTDRRQDIYG